MSHQRRNILACWVEAMRLRTLPVSVAGVILAVGYALHFDCFNPIIATICLAFAVLAQIASNFANEYYDFKAGLDAPGRQGPRRGVTEGDITPRAMLIATYITLALACILGCSLIYWGGWWLLPAGILIALGVVAYSAGPYPLSHHGLGEAAVIFFFGIIPVNLTFYIQSLSFNPQVALGSVALGLMGANVLLVNNYRDAQSDKAVGKRTLAVVFGRRFALYLYLINGLAAAALMILSTMLTRVIVLSIVYTISLISIWLKMRILEGHALTPLLGITALDMLIFSIAFAVIY